MPPRVLYLSRVLEDLSRWLEVADLHKDLLSYWLQINADKEKNVE